MCLYSEYKSRVNLEILIYALIVHAFKHDKVTYCIEISDVPVLKGSSTEQR